MSTHLNAPGAGRSAGGRLQADDELAFDYVFASFELPIYGGPPPPHTHTHTRPPLHS